MKSLMGMIQSALRGQTMTKTEIIEALSNEAGLTTSKGKEVVKVFINEISNALTNNERVEIRGLCSFFVKQYKGYAGRNPKTGKPIKVKPKKLPSFKCSKELKERVDTHI
jgi:integration host factor subunit beta